MRILISGICGFVGSTLAREFARAGHRHEILGFDNFIRQGSEGNRAELKATGATIFHADLRSASDVDALPAADFVIDAAANPSVLAGIDGRSSSRQVVEHNLSGTINLLEYCKARKAGLILLSTSRVYSIEPLSSLPVTVKDEAFTVDAAKPLPVGVSAQGLAEDFSTAAPISLYGATKLASEAMALEYGGAFGFPVFVNRCGVLAGAGQFGRADQGIFAFWINSWLRQRPLRYLGFGGTGHQVRDCLHPRDLISVLAKQLAGPKVAAADRLANFSGGASSAMSLAQLSRWCAARFGARTVAVDGTPREFDLPWIVLDSSRAERIWGWKPPATTATILDEIAAHAERHPEWLDRSAPL